MAQRPLVAIVDDDKSIRTATSDLLKAAGFAAAAFEDAESFLGWPTRASVACLVADMRMPGMAGLELYEALVAAGHAIPTIIITAHPEELTQARDLAVGIGCYLSKPFAPDELSRLRGRRAGQCGWRAYTKVLAGHPVRLALVSLRTAAVYLGVVVRRRSGAYACIVNLQTMEQAMTIPAMNLQPPGARLCFDGFELDEVDALLTCEGEPVAIAPRPFAVLCALARRPGRLLTKGDMLDAVWGHRFVTDSVLKSAICHVRAALHDDPRQPRYIETVSRRGYRFIVPLESTSAPRRHAEDDADNADNPDNPDKPDLALRAALTTLCRGDAALAELIRTVAATLERDRHATEH